MTAERFTYITNTITALAPASEYNFVSPTNGTLTVASVGKLKVELSSSHGVCYVAFCPSHGTVSNIPVNVSCNVKIINMDHNYFDVYTTVVTERPQISFSWNS